MWDQLLTVLTRFPLAFIIILLATIVSFIMVDGASNTSFHRTLFKLLFCSNLAFVLVLSADLCAESHQLVPLRRWGLQTVSILIVVALFFNLDLVLYAGDRLRFGLLAVAFHLLVAFAPFINRGNQMGFWEYNKVLFIRILTAGLYAFVLYLGLAVAIVAVENLFSVKINNHIYGYLASLIGIAFTSVFFLAGVPSDFHGLSSNRQPYPKGLKIFAQYVLIPLLSIYLLILLAYEAKIVVSWELPKGMVSTLIIGYAGFGILSILLIEPVKDDAGNGWIKPYAKLFYVMMIPLVVLLMLAVWERVRTYGITEPRYILMLLAIWLTGLTVYFLVSKKDNLKIIPISLCLLALLGTYGPQSAGAISRSSQQQRLAKMMRNQDAASEAEKTSVIAYLVKSHGLTSLQEYTKADLSAVEAGVLKKYNSEYAQHERLIDTAYRLLKVKDVPVIISNSFIYLGEAVNVASYQAMIPVDSYMGSVESKMAGETILIKKVNPQSMQVSIGTSAPITIQYAALMRSVAKRFGGGNQNPRERVKAPEKYMSTIVATDRYELKLVADEVNVSGSLQTGIDFKGFLLIKIK